MINLKQLRKSKGISQQQLADVIGVSQQSINKYENHNVEPDIRTLISIAEYFNTTVDFLVGKGENEKENEFCTVYELTQDEAFIMNRYRMLGKDEKESIRLIIKNYTK
ncbi:MAG: helix-turn-helix transcriptional regulator [Clostridia bacterium]|nr:helix-turn-helix transcriptional regulator [Clostridia bacterium]